MTSFLDQIIEAHKGVSSGPIVKAIIIYSLLDYVMEAVVGDEKYFIMGHNQWNALRGIELDAIRAIPVFHDDKMAADIIARAIKGERK